MCAIDCPDSQGGDLRVDRHSDGTLAVGGSRGELRVAGSVTGMAVDGPAASFVAGQCQTSRVGARPGWFGATWAELELCGTSLPIGGGAADEPWMKRAVSTGVVTIPPAAQLQSAAKAVVRSSVGPGGATS
jgi:hypothetical protein